MGLDMDYSWNRANAAAQASDEAIREKEKWLMEFDPSRPGMSDEEVRMMQRFVGVKDDGKWGPKSEAARQELLGRTPEYVEQKRLNELEAAEQDVYRQKLERLQELEAKRAERLNKISSSPEYKLAAMMAMAGQPGALQSLISTSAANANNGNKFQEQMDSLETQIANDAFALASADDDKAKRIIKMLYPLYESKYRELESKGAVGRTGWDRIKKFFDESMVVRNKKKAENLRNKSNLKTAADKMDGGL